MECLDQSKKAILEAFAEQGLENSHEQFPEMS